VSLQNKLVSACSKRLEPANENFTESALSKAHLYFEMRSKIDIRSIELLIL